MSNEIFNIPKENAKLRSDIKQRKNSYMLHVYKSFSKLLENKSKLPDKINLFKFTGTNLEVIVKKQSYITNVENLLEYFTQEENYEICAELVSIINYIKNNNSEDS